MKYPYLSSNLCEHLFVSQPSSWLQYFLLNFERFLDTYQTSLCVVALKATRTALFQVVRRLLNENFSVP